MAGKQLDLINDIDNYRNIEVTAYEDVRGKRILRKSSEHHSSSLYAGEKKDVPLITATEDGLVIYGDVKKADSEGNFVDALYNGSIFVIDVQPIDATKNINIIYCDAPNEEEVKSFTTDTNDVLVTLEWNRASNYRGAPTIYDKEILTYTSKVGSVYTESVSTSLSGTELEFSYSGVNELVEFTREMAPNFITLALYDSYPTGQTEVKEGDDVYVTIECDAPFDRIEVQDLGVGKPFTLDIEPTTQYNLKVEVADRDSLITTGGLNKAHNAYIIVRGTNGSKTGWTPTTDQMLLSNIYPTTTLLNSSISYPIGQEAIKDSEVVSMPISGKFSNLDSLTVSSTQLSVQGGDIKNITTLTATRVTGDYNDASNNLFFVAKRDANGSESTFNKLVEIAHTMPALSSNTPVKVRSGTTSTSVSNKYTQYVKVLAASVGDTFGSIAASPITSTYTKSKSAYISATDADVHATSTRLMPLTVSNKAGKQTVLYRNYYIQGFQTKTLIMDSLNLRPFEISIGTTVVTPTNVRCAGLVNSTTTFPVATVYEAGQTLKLADKYTIIGESLDTLLISSAASQFGYDSGMTITITIYEL